MPQRRKRRHTQPVLRERGADGGWSEGADWSPFVECFECDVLARGKTNCEVCHQSKESPSECPGGSDKSFKLMFNKKNFESSLNKMMYEYKFYVEKMNNYPHDTISCASKYLKLFRRLSKDHNFIDNNDRFYKHPFKTIKSLFII